MFKVGVSCRKIRRRQMAVLSDNQNEESFGDGAEGRGREGWGMKKNRWERGNEEGEMENKRGHWRQIKDTQLNDWMDGPLDLNGHLHPPPAPSATGQENVSSCFGFINHHHTQAYLIIRATSTSQYATLCCKGVSIFLACCTNTRRRLHRFSEAKREREEWNRPAHWLQRGKEPEACWYRKILHNKVLLICALIFFSLINKKRSIEDECKKTTEVKLVEHQEWF